MATTSYATLDSAYVPVNTGPCFIELRDPGTVRVVVQTTNPVPGYAAYHTISYPSGTFSYSGSETVYVLSVDDRTPNLVVTAIL